MKNTKLMILGVLFCFNQLVFAKEDVKLSAGADNITVGKVITMTFSVTKFSPKTFPEGYIQATLGNINKQIKFQDSGAPVTLTYTVTKKDIANGFINSQVFYIRGNKVRENPTLFSFIKILSTETTDAERAAFSDEMLKAAGINDTERKNFKEKNYDNDSSGSSSGSRTKSK